MAKVTVAPGEQIDSSIFWPAGGSNIVGEALKGVIDQAGSLVNGIGDSKTTYKELSFKVGDLTYHYIGNFALDIVGGLLGATSSLTGSYTKVVVDKAGEFLTSLDLDKALDADFGTSSNLNILGLDLGGILHTVLKDVLGTVDNVLGVVTSDVTPSVMKLVDSLISDDSQSNVPTPHDDVLVGTKDKDVINALAGDDTVHAAGGPDVIHGNAGKDHIWGGAGNDQLYGDAGKDFLHGGAGRDKLTGGSGHDILYGDRGADTFVFKDSTDSKVAAAGRDTIMDFSHGQHDKINLHAIDADTTRHGNQDFHLGHGSHFHGDAGELIVSTKGSETFVKGDTNGDGKADFSIELHGTLHLHNSDFQF